MILGDILSGILVVVFLIIIYAPVLLLHELGHYLMFRLFGYKPKLKLSPVGDLEIGTEYHDRMTLTQSVFIILGGIFLGILPFAFYKMLFPPLLMIGLAFAYIIGIGLDLMTLQMILFAVSKRKMNPMKATMYDMNENVWIRYKEEVKKK